MIQKNETLEELHARHAKVAYAVAERAKHQTQAIIDRAKEKLFVLRGRHALDVQKWQREHKA